MRTHIHTLLLACVLAMTVIGTARQSSANAQEMPGEEAMISLAAFIGDWQFQGVAHSGIDGVRPGELFMARQTVRWKVPMEELAIEWQIFSEGGVAISMGRARMRWDDIAGAILNTYAGEDGTKSFKGVATLIGVNGGDFDWRGHESSGTGESLNYETTYALLDTDRWQIDFIPTCADDTVLEPMQFTWERANAFKRSIGEFASVVGKWTRMYQDASGRTVLSTLNIGWGPGERALLMAMQDEVDGEKTFQAAEMLFHDPVSTRIRSRFIGARGSTGDGRFEFDRENGVPFALNRCSGVNDMGEDFVCLFRIEVDGDTLTRRCLEFAINGSPMEQSVLDGMTEIFNRGD